jgi:hypothetical protein
MTIVLLCAGLAVGCDVNTYLQQQAEARHVASDLALQFTRAADASNRAVMAEADDASRTYAREAEASAQAVQTRMDALKPLLESLNYRPELELLATFEGQFREYRELDRRILELAVEHTNLRAQRLSFGPGRDAAEAFGAALDPIASAGRSKGHWQAAALAASAVAAVREIQVLQAPHIAEPGEQVMADLEKRMALAEAAARKALTDLAPVVEPESRPRVSAASAALDRFMSVHAEVIAFSRRNTNVRSLALSLDQKRTLVAACEATLRGLQDALAARRLTGSR